MSESIKSVRFNDWIADTCQGPRIGECRLFHPSRSDAYRPAIDRRLQLRSTGSFDGGRRKHSFSGLVPSVAAAKIKGPMKRAGSIGSVIIVPSTPFPLSAGPATPLRLPLFGPC